jgi:hypothetical protein
MVVGFHDKRFVTPLVKQEAPNMESTCLAGGMDLLEFTDQQLVV